MSDLRLGFRPNYDVPEDTYVPTKVLNSRFETVRVVMLSLRGGSENLRNVEPGLYFVLAELPSGETVKAQAEVPAQTKVTLDPSHSPREWLAWQRFLGEDAVPQPLSSELRSRHTQTWIRLWRREGSEYVLDPGLLVDGRQGYPLPDELGPIVVYLVDLARQRPGLRFVQIGGPTVPWRLVSLPYSRFPIEVLVRPSRLPSSQNGGLAVKVVTRNARAETLSHYLGSGAITTARYVSEDLLGEADEYHSLPDLGRVEPTEAEALLRGKLADPYGAAIGGYYLLRSAEYERLHNWPRNFADWVKWLPDATLLHAWQLLYSGAEEKRPNARDRLLDAARRGLPVLTEGFRLLIEGLSLFASDAQGRGQPDRAVEEALADLRRYASAVDWGQRLTTFYGADPLAPSVEPITGIPEGTSDGLRFLGQV